MVSKIKGESRNVVVHQSLVHIGIGILTPEGITQSLYFKTSSVAIRGRRFDTPIDMRRPSDITADYISN